MASFAKVTITPPPPTRITVRTGGGRVTGGGGPAVINIEQSVPARATSGNYEALSEVAIALSPYAGTTPSVRVNGVEYGASSFAWRFQRSGVDVAPTLVQAGDICIWRGADVGFDIEPLDEVSFLYEVAQ